MVGIHIIYSAIFWTILDSNFSYTYIQKAQIDLKRLKIEKTQNGENGKKPIKDQNGQKSKGEWNAK